MAKRKVDSKKVGQRIRQVRGDRTQTEFAKAIGLAKPSQQHNISRYEAGRLPSHELLVRISDLGGVSIDWLLTGQEAPRKQVKAA